RIPRRKAEDLRVPRGPGHEALWWPGASGEDPGSAPRGPGGTIVSEPRVLVVGQGGREHALVDAIHNSVEHPRLFAAPGNPGMEPLAERVALQATDVDGITKWSRDHGMDLVVIGPDAAIAAGLADSLRAAGIDAFGPEREAGRLEWSKRYAKEML